MPAHGELKMKRGEVYRALGLRAEAHLLHGLPCRNLILQITEWEEISLSSLQALISA